MTEKVNFLGGLVPTLRQEYQERKKYRQLVNDDRLIDIWYDNYGYGFRNNNFEPVTLINNGEIIKRFTGFADGVGALNFVVDAFVAFRDDFINKIENSTIGYPPFLDGLIPVKGYQNFEDLYSNWHAYSATKYASALQESKKIYNYKSFLEEIKEQFKQNLSHFPVTKSGFCFSQHNEVGTSGLSIELANLDYDQDFEKGEIVQNFNFQCYADLAQAYGFYVDKNAPWRLLCNLDHPTTRIFIRSLDLEGLGLSGDQAHQHLTTHQILDNIYRTKTHFDDLFLLQDFLTKIYNQIKKDVPFFTKRVYNVSTNALEKQKVFRKEVDFLSNEEWVETLVMVRLLEIGSYSEQRHRDITTAAQTILRISGMRRCLGMIGTEMSKLIKVKLTENESGIKPPPNPGNTTVIRRRR